MDGTVTISLEDYERMAKRLQRYEATEKRITEIIIDHLDYALKKNLEPEDLYKDSIDLQSLCMIMKLESEFDNTFAMLSARKRGQDE